MTDAADHPGGGPGDAKRLLEAILFQSPEPLTVSALARLLPPGTDVLAVLTALAADYAGRGVHLVRAGDHWSFLTAPDLASSMAHARAGERRLSRAAIETLAVIAYHQPVTRAEIEDLRGVQLARGTFDALFELGWVAPCGRRETPGWPMQWGTTDGFLRHFGLASLRDLPRLEELQAAGLLDRPFAAAPPAAGDPTTSTPRDSDP